MLEKMDRAELVELAKRQPEVLPSELASAMNDGSLLFRFIGHLLREQEKSRADAILAYDLITEEGRMRAIQGQGNLQGREALLEDVLEFILSGVKEDEH